MANTKATDRYRRIHEIFNRRRGSQSLGIKLQDLAEELGISLRQLNDDIRELKELGAPLEYVPSLRAWRYAEGKDFLHIEGMFINYEDATHLRIALETFQRIDTQGKLLGSMPEVFRKIYKASRKWTKSDVFQKIIHFDPLPKYEGSRYLPFFLEAAEHQRRVTFDYQAFHATAPKQVVFDPWFLRHYDRRWYVGGFSHDPDERFVRVFPLERITGTPVSIGFYHDKPPQYNAETYWKHIYGISVPKDGQIDTVVLEFSPLQGKYFCSSPFFEPFEVLEDTPERLIVRLQIIINIELIRKLASYGVDVHVHQPIELVVRLRQFFEAALARSAAKIE
jgi:predicted DNA-binding transcriptional regulator YafY